MNHSKCCKWLPLILILLFSSSISADVRLPAVISDNMVLQQGMKVSIWGMAETGERVTVTLGSQRITATANDNGNWKVNLNPMKAGGPFEMLIVGNNTITLHNVMVGEVWVCSGQSNMWWPVNRSAIPEYEIAKSEYPMIRLFTVNRQVAGTPQNHAEGEWLECSPQTVGDFSAVGYFFGRELHKTLGTPVGLIHTSWGGTPAESWTSLPTLKSEPDFKPILDRFEQAMKIYPQAKEKYEKQMTRWKQEVEKAKIEGKPEPNQPRQPLGPEHPYRPAGLYNGMVAPIIPYGIKGVIWYQGESNAGRAFQYRKLFKAMIQDWRRSWSQGNFPFLFVQLANYMEIQPQPVDDEWAELREAQLMALASQKTAMAVTIDIGDADDIHPKNKQEVGRRLSLGALAIAYGHDIEYSGPIYDSMSIKNDKIRLRFKHTDGGLVTKGNEPLKGFAIAGKNRKFFWANAEIDGDELVVWSNQVPKPVAVRYAWASNPVCNLYNKAGLPASPFRTDNWHGITVDKK